jgi:aminopeptidase N
VDAKSMESENRYNASAKRVNDILNTKLEVSFNFATAQLNGKATIDIQPYFYATDSLVLDAKSFDIEKVAMLSKDGAMSDLNFKYDSAQIHIGLGKMFTKNESYRIFIQYKANPNKVKNASSAAITDAKGSLSVKTVSGGTLIASIENGKVILTDEKGAKATVVATDLKAGNGVVHVIDSVVLPK